MQFFHTIKILHFLRTSLAQPGIVQPSAGRLTFLGHADNGITTLHGPYAMAPTRVLPVMILYGHVGGEGFPSTEATSPTGNVRSAPPRRGAGAHSLIGQSTVPSERRPTGGQPVYLDRADSESNRPAVHSPCIELCRCPLIPLQCGTIQYNRVAFRSRKSDFMNQHLNTRTHVHTYT